MQQPRHYHTPPLACHLAVFNLEQAHRPLAVYISQSAYVSLQLVAITPMGLGVGSDGLGRPGGGAGGTLGSTSRKNYFFAL
jgi:hypothetical protein